MTVSVRLPYATWFMNSLSYPAWYYLKIISGRRDGLAAEIAALPKDLHLIANTHMAIDSCL